VSQFYRAAFAVIAPEVGAELGLSAAALGLASGAFFVALGVVQLPVGMLFDRYGPRRVIAALTGLAVLGALGHGGARGLGELVASHVLLGLGCAGSFMGAVVLCGRWYGGERFTTRLAWVFALSNLGIVAAATPLAVASARLGWRWAFVGAAGLTAAVGAGFALLARDAPPGTAPAPAARERLADVLGGLRAVWRTPGLAPVLAIHTFAYASMLTVLGLWAGPYLWDVHGLDPLGRGHVLTAMSLAQVAGILAYGPLDRLFNTRKWIIVPGAAASVALLALLAALPRPPLGLAAALLVLLCLVSAYGVVIVAHGRSLFPDRLAGRGVTTVNLAQVAGTSFLPVLTGGVLSLVDAWRPGAASLGYRAMFASIAVCLLAGLAGYSRAHDAPPRPARAADRRATATPPEA